MDLTKGNVILVSSVSRKFRIKAASTQSCSTPGNNACLGLCPCQDTLRYSLSCLADTSGTAAGVVQYLHYNACSPARLKNAFLVKGLKNSATRWRTRGGSAAALRQNRLLQGRGIGHQLYSYRKLGMVLLGTKGTASSNEHHTDRNNTNKHHQGGFGRMKLPCPPHTPSHAVSSLCCGFFWGG